MQREGSLKSCFFLCTEGAGGGGGVRGVTLLFPLKQWKLRGDMQRCAHEWQGLWDVCGSLARGLRPKAPFPAPHNEGAQGRDLLGVTGHPPFVPHFKTHKHLLIKRQPLCLCPPVRAVKRRVNGPKKLFSGREKDISRGCRERFHHLDTEGWKFVKVAAWQRMEMRL